MNEQLMQAIYNDTHAGLDLESHANFRESTRLFHPIYMQKAVVQVADFHARTDGCVNRTMSYESNAAAIAALIAEIRQHWAYIVGVPAHICPFNEEAIRNWWFQYGRTGLDSPGRTSYRNYVDAQLAEVDQLARR